MPASAAFAALKARLKCSGRKGPAGELVQLGEMCIRDSSKTMGRHVKSVDNALQRIKRKLQKYLEKK